MAQTVKLLIAIEPLLRHIKLEETPVAEHYN
jgi:hypothetical protein